MLRTITRRSPRLSRRRNRRSRVWWWLGGFAVFVVAGAGFAVWMASQVAEVKTAVAPLPGEGRQLQSQLVRMDLTGAGATMTHLRANADRAHRLTSGPHWALASALPVIGPDVKAVVTMSETIARISDAAAPMESALPRLDPSRGQAATGRVDVAALSTISQAMPGLADAVDEGAAAVQALNPDPLQPQIGDAVRVLQTTLSTAQGPVHGASSAFGVLPTLLGADGPKTYLVMLQQDAEARGTGGLMGSYALIRAEDGRLSLLSAQSRGALPLGAAIPTNTLPTSLQDLWGTDLNEWAGLNLSPHFPWTGQLVQAGWKAHGGTPDLDYVAAVDDQALAALLAGTGPVSVNGVNLTSANAASFLSRDIYKTIRNPAKIDTFTAALVSATLDRISHGRLAFQPLVTSLAQPVKEHRFLLWAADPALQTKLERTAVGGAVPDDPGPFAMAVVNNGGGNKLDAYLKVSTDYDPGTCRQDVRLGHIKVTLTNQAPTKGLPDYVNQREDLIDKHQRNPHPGSNRLILTVYGPVGATSPLATLDGQAVDVTTGEDRDHPVWRTEVLIDPGQTRTLDVLVLDPASGATAGAAALPPPVVRTQAMAQPATARAAPLSPCTAN